jgi:hypothetical protein
MSTGMARCSSSELRTRSQAQLWASPGGWQAPSPGWGWGCSWGQVDPPVLKPAPPPLPSSPPPPTWLKRGQEGLFTYRRYGSGGPLSRICPGSEPNSSEDFTYASDLRKRRSGHPNFRFRPDKRVCRGLIVMRGVFPMERPRRDAPPSLAASAASGEALRPPPRSGRSKRPSRRTALEAVLRTRVSAREGSTPAGETLGLAAEEEARDSP